MLTLNLKSAVRLLVQRRILTMLAVAITLCAPVVTAQSADRGKALLVQLKNGDKQYFMLSDEPVITFADYQCHIESQELGADFEMAMIDHAKIVDFDPASVDEIESALIVDLSNPSVVIIRGMKANGNVSLFNLSGMMLRQTSADESGTAMLEVGDLATGVYVVTSNETTFKIYKK